ncbi:hypothetical protein [Flagellimonas profundi]|uniref:MlpB protein n=1 Tax=Flagellimonas profundi TaxID=2915620 RepID=A0ABS3FBZ4_9FLAO|nr:hypothetical protein [Allomuricauda profundi]MBO0340685.1 hypothetical protein [Allomuricauda profundi]
MTKHIIITAFAIITLMGCNTEAKRTKISETPSPTTAQNKVEEAQPKKEMTQNYQVGSQVPTELVCMVNDAYMGKIQMPVPVNGKTYYGCCQMCVKTLNEHDEARTALDPFSKQRVDKTEAFIVLMGMDGKVAYFESEENFLKFKEVGRMNH